MPEPEHTITSSCPKEIISSIPIFKDNDLIIPFVKDGTKAYDKAGLEYILTSEALDKDFKSYENGHITVNHKQLETGTISEVWRQKPFVYGRISGLTDELRQMILSPAYKGVSQESIPALFKPGTREVISLNGKGTTILFYPEQPACSKDQGCGTIQDNSNFSLNSSQKIDTIKNTGGTKTKMADYTAAQITDMLTFLKANPGLLDDAMRAMMSGMMGKGAGDVQSSIPELTAKETEILGLKAKIVELEKGTPIQIESAVKSALIAREADLAATKMHDDAVKELMSSMPKAEAEAFLGTKPSPEQMITTARIIKSSKGVGASSGEQIDSSRPKEDEIKAGIQKLRVAAGMTKRRVK